MVEKVLPLIDNIATVNLNDLDIFLYKETAVVVYAYYDSGITGYELPGNNYVTYQQPYLNGEEKTYYAINNQGKFVETTDVLDNIYRYNRTNNQLSITNIISNKNSSIQLGYSKNGFLYAKNLILQKQINEALIGIIDGTNVIHFDLIIPGISLLNNKREWTIVTKLDKVEFTGKIITQQVLTNKKISIDVYKTDENQRNEKYEKTVVKDISDFDSIIEIDGLVPKTYYFLQFKAIVDSNGTQSERLLYDVDYQQEGKKYYFSTLADVGITDINVTYNPLKYLNKSIDISYKLDKTVGYDRIVYKFEKYNSLTKKYEAFNYVTPDDLVPKKDMVKKLDVNPNMSGEKFVFGQKYKVTIIPMAKYTDPQGETADLELGPTAHEFTLQQLKQPMVAMKGTRADDSITFKVSVYDQSKIIVDDKYTITITEEGVKDVTPEVYKNQQFESGSYNVSYTINNTDPLKKYRLVVNATLDDENNATNLKPYQRSYEVNAINNYGISAGNILANTIIKDKLYYINLIFNNSYQLAEIEEMKYSIYNINGFAISGTSDFIPEKTTSTTGEIYYQYVIESPIPQLQEGTYYIELQFYKENNLVCTDMVEYVYLK